MRRALPLVVAAAALAGCGLGAGEGAQDVTLTVSRDFGARELGRERRDTPGDDTVIRLLQRSFDVKTRYGGSFVQAVDGVAGGERDGRPYDWFYYVNGVLAPKGAAQTPVGPGDRILWDLHDWGAAMDTRAIVGQFPEPFVHGTEGEQVPTVLQCAPDAGPACDETAAALAGAGVPVPRGAFGTGTGRDTLRVLVGSWGEVRGSVAARQLERGVRVSGVYVVPRRGGRELEVLDERGRTRRRLGAGTGLVAATRIEEQEPTWLVTGTDAAGVRAAARALRPRVLARKWAAVVTGGRAVAVP